MKRNREPPLQGLEDVIGAVLGVSFRLSCLLAVLAIGLLILVLRGVAFVLMALATPPEPSQPGNRRGRL